MPSGLLCICSFSIINATGGQTHGWVLVLLSEWKKQYDFSSKLQRFKLNSVIENILSQTSNGGGLYCSQWTWTQFKFSSKINKKLEMCHWCTVGGATSQVTWLFLASQNCPAKRRLPNLFMFQPGDSCTSVHRLSLLTQGWHKAHASLH